MSAWQHVGCFPLLGLSHAPRSPGNNDTAAFHPALSPCRAAPRHDRSRPLNLNLDKCLSGSAVAAADPASGVMRRRQRHTRRGSMWHRFGMEWEMGRQRRTHDDYTKAEEVGGRGTYVERDGIHYVAARLHV